MGQPNRRFQKHRRGSGPSRGSRRALAGNSLVGKRRFEFLEERAMLAGDFAITQVMTGSEALPGGLVFRAQQEAVISASGQVLVTGNLSGTGVTTANRFALVLGTSGNASLIARQGDPIPGTSGVLYDNLFDFPDRATLVGNNIVGFAMSDSEGGTTTHHSIWKGGAGGVEIATPFADGTIVAHANDTGVSAGGHVAYEFFTGSETQVFLNGQQIHSTDDFVFVNGEQLQYGSIGFVEEINASGQFPLSMQLFPSEGQPRFVRGVHVMGPGGVMRTVTNETIVTGGPTALDINAMDINDAGQVLLEVIFTGADITSANNQAVYLWSGDTFTLVAREGETIPGSTLLQFPNDTRQPGFALSGSGQVLYNNATTDSPTPNGVAVWTSGTWQVIAEEGMQAPGAAAGVTFASFGGAAINDSGTIVFSAKLSDVSTSEDDGIWARVNGQLKNVVRDNDELQTSTGAGNIRVVPFEPETVGTGENGRRTVLTDDDRVVFTTLTNGVFVANLNSAPPEPGKIRGVVWSDEDDDGVRDSTEPGLEDVEVRLQTEAGQAVGTPVQTDEQGNYQFSDLAPGNYRVVVTAVPGTVFASTGGDAEIGDTGISAVINVSAGSTIEADAALVPINTVNSTGDEPDLTPGDGNIDTGETVTINGKQRPKVTLRAALMEFTESTGNKEVKFKIPDTDPGFANGVWTIQPASPLPEITTLISIDGYTQTGATEATATAAANLAIQLDGVLLPPGPTAIGLQVTGTLTTIEGLNLVRFDRAGIVVSAGTNIVAGNYIGVGPDGTAILDDDGLSMLGNGTGIEVVGTQLVSVGGVAVSQRNVISGNRLDGIRLEQAMAINNVNNNIIGLDAAGTSAIGNGRDGVRIVDSSGTRVTDGNVISGNFGAGVRIVGAAATDNRIENNLIGPNIFGSGGFVGNLLGGVIIEGGSGNIIGGADNVADGNLIAYNGFTDATLNANAAGVYVFNGGNNAILGNQINNNLGLGIDLGPIGVTRNQDLPADHPGAGGNDLANFPVLTVDENGRIRTTLHATPNRNYRIEYFTSDMRDVRGHGDGKTFLGSIELFTNASGDAVDTPLIITAPPDKWISATATEQMGGAPNITFLSTSEFSQSVRRGSLPEVTVITHGFVAQTSSGDTLKDLGDAIVARTGGNLLDYEIDVQGGQGDFVTSVDPNKHNVLLFDWASESNEPSPGWAEAAADALFALLVQQDLLNPAAGAANGNLHFIAHSFGAALNSEVVERLAVYGVPVDHLTYLDPHDFDETGVPVDESQREFDIGQPQLGDPRGLNYGATVWNNVNYAETYFQTRSIGSGPNVLFPEGRPILGSYNYFLDTELPDASGVFAPYSDVDSDHSWVWNVFYRGSVEGNGGRTDGAAPEIEVPPYSAQGYAFSRALGGAGDRPAAVFPAGAIGATDGPNEWTHPNLNTGSPTTRFAPQWDPHTIVNGDFEAPGTVVTGNFVDIVPGWSHYGGGGDGDVSPDRDENSVQNHYLELDFADASRTHNYMYVPHTIPDISIQFDLQRSDASSDDELQVYFDDGAGTVFPIATIDLGATDTGFVRQSFPVPTALIGDVTRLTFEIVTIGGSGVVDSEVFIDNVVWAEPSTGVSGIKFEDVNGDGDKDPGEDGLAGWTIFADLDGSGFLDGGEPFTLTGPTGQYTLPLAPGQYTIREVPEERWVLTTEEAIDVTVVQDETVTGVDFGNFEAMKLSGVKFIDINGDGFQNAGEPGNPGWTIELLDDAGQVIDSVETDAEGQFEFDELEPSLLNSVTGSFSVREVEQDGFTQTRRATDTMPLNSGEDRAGFDFGNFEHVVVRGFKYNDTDGNGTRDTGEPGIIGWTIHLDLNNDGSNDFTTTTDATGRYEFEDVTLTPAQISSLNRTFVLREELLENWVQTGEPLASFDISSGESYTTGTDFLNFETMTVRGVKFDDTDGDGVKDAGEPGVGGIVIEIDLDADGVAEYSDTTSEDGSYEITGIGPRDNRSAGQFLVREVLPSGTVHTLPTSGQYSFTIESGAVDDGINFGNFKLMTLGGVKYDDLNGNGVRDGNEPGLAGWTINVDLNSDGSIDHTTTTAAGGSWEFTNLVGPGNSAGASTYTVTESPSTAQAELYVQTGPAGGSYVRSIESGAVRLDHHFGNFELITLSGVKFADLSGNGARGQNEPGLGGWTIQLDLDNNGTFDRSAITNAAGIYTFDRVGPGTHRLSEIPQVGYAISFPSDNQHVIATTSGEDESALDFGNRPVVSFVAGTKYNDLNRDGDRDDGEPGLPGWIIYLDADNDGVLDNPTSGDNVADEFATEIFVPTDADGNYYIIVQPGAYVVRELLQPRWQQSAPQNGFHAGVNESLGNSRAGLDFGNFERRAISGTKFEDLDGDGVKDGGEPGLSGWTIELRDASSALIATTTTDTGGTYQFTNLAAGAYNATEILQAGFAQTFPGSAGRGPIDLTQTVEASGIDFGNFKLGTIRGTLFLDADEDGIRDSGEGPLSGWTVFLDADDDGQLDVGETSIATTTAGEYQFNNLAQGSYKIAQVLQPGFTRTAPALGNHAATIATSGQTISDLDFANVSAGMEIDLGGEGDATSVVLTSGGKSQTIRVRRGVAKLRISGENLTTQNGNGPTQISGDNLVIDEVQITQSTRSTSLKFKVEGGNGEMTIGNLVVTQSIGRIVGRGLTIAGNITIGGTARLIEINTLADDHLVTIGAPQRPNDTTTFKANLVQNADINSATPLKKIDVASWIDDDADPDTITAPWIGSLRSRSGDFEADLALSGVGTRKTALRKVTVAGDLSDATWNAPTLRKLHVGGDLSNFELNLTQAIDSARPAGKTLDKLSVEGRMQDVIVRSAGNIGKVSAGAILDSLIFAGINSALDELPTSVADFTAQVRIKAVTARGIDGLPDAFAGSSIAAWTIDEGLLNDVATANAASKFGIAARTIDRLRLDTPAGPLNLKDLTPSTAPPPINDFEFRLF